MACRPSIIDDEFPDAVCAVPYAVKIDTEEDIPEGWKNCLFYGYNPNYLTVKDALKLIKQNETTPQLDLFNK